MVLETSVPWQLSLLPCTHTLLPNSVFEDAVELLEIPRKKLIGLPELQRELFMIGYASRARWVSYAHVEEELNPLLCSGFS